MGRRSSRRMYVPEHSDIRDAVALILIDRRVRCTYMIAGIRVAITTRLVGRYDQSSRRVRTSYSTLFVESSGRISTARSIAGIDRIHDRRLHCAGNLSSLALGSLLLGLILRQLTKRPVVDTPPSNRRFTLQQVNHEPR